VLKKNFLNPLILEFCKATLDSDVKKETPTKKGAVKSILKSKKRDQEGAGSNLASSSEAGTE